VKTCAHRRKQEGDGGERENHGHHDVEQGLAEELANDRATTGA
jgi:hypothetical protein